MYDIESVISPCANSQPTNIMLPSQWIQRIPMLVDENGITPEFQKFYESVVCVVGAVFQMEECSVTALYNLTDKSIKDSSYFKLIATQWATHINKMYDAKQKKVGVGFDIELNMERFQSIHRNLVGGFNIITYYTDIQMDSFTEGCEIPQIVQSSTEILFTYRDSKFVLLTQLTPFVCE